MFRPFERGGPITLGKYQPTSRRPHAPCTSHPPIKLDPARAPVRSNRRAFRLACLVRAATAIIYGPVTPIRPASYPRSPDRHSGRRLRSAAPTSGKSIKNGSANRQVIMTRPISLMATQSLRACAGFVWTRTPVSYQRAFVAARPRASRSRHARNSPSDEGVRHLPSTAIIEVPRVSTQCIVFRG